MVFPTIRVPQLLLFVEAASMLRDSSQILLQAGQVAADLPELIAAAQARAEDQLESLRIPSDLQAQVYGILRLTPPPLVLAYVQDLIDSGSGPDLEAFLEQVGSASTLLRFPPTLVGLVALGLLLERLDFSPEEAATIQTSRAQLEQTLVELADYHAIDLEPLRAATETVLESVSPEELLQLGQDLWAADPEPEPAPQPELAGPLLFMMVADHLLTQTEFVLTPEQRLDLQTNRAQAEARYLAMQKLGRIQNLAEQQAYIQSWIDQNSPADLLQAMDQFFAVLEEDSSS
ncbi:MAG: hypothetical protein Q6K80_10475 [Thermostichus sp. DG_1_6_bins_120]